MATLPPIEHQVGELQTSVLVEEEELYALSYNTMVWVAVGVAWLMCIDAARMGTIPTPYFVAIVVSFLLASLSAWIHGRSGRMARIVLSWGLASSYLGFVSAYPSGPAPYLGMLLILGCTSLLSRLELAGLTLLLCLGVVGVRALLTPSLRPALSLYDTLPLLLLTVPVSWLDQRPLRLALAWASQSTARALILRDHLRERQLVLNRTLRAMDEANARLAQANARLQEARRAAEDAQRAKSLFAANISHELRTPLNLIVGFSQVMYETPQAYADVTLAPDFMLDLGVVYRNAQHLQGLVDDVLDLAAIETGNLSIQPQATQMAQLIAEALATVGNLVKVRGLALQTEITIGLPLLMVDRTRIRQVLLNLLSNAARYTERGSITVRAWADAYQLYCSVTDTGPGIAKEKQALIFREFERLDQTDAREQRGFGLGLAISKGFMRAHGGDIWVDSELGVGSVFTIALPIHEADALPELGARGEVGPSSDAEVQGRAVLVTPALTGGRLLSRHLDHTRCVIAQNVAQAAEQIATLQPYAVIADACLSPEDLAALEQAILDRHVTGRCLLCAVPMPGGQRLPPDLPIKAFLSKPISRGELMDTLRALGEEISEVLVVDDEEDGLRLFTRLLLDSTRPYQVTMARNGREALQMIERSRPDLIFLDLMMPVMDGHRLLVEMQERGLIDIPIVLISGQEIQEPDQRIDEWLRFKMPGGVPLQRLVLQVNDVLRALYGGLVGRR